MGDPIVVRAQHGFQVTGVAVALATSRASGNAIDAERDAASAHRVLCKNAGGQRALDASRQATQAVRCAPASR